MVDLDSLRGRQIDRRTEPLVAIALSGLIGSLSTITNVLFSTVSVVEDALNGPLNPTIITPTNKPKSFLIHLARLTTYCKHI